MERDARYAAVALFALAAIAAAFAFVWWYSGQGDRRSYERYEIYFEGSVSGLAQGSPVRYLGVDVGRVRSLSVDRRDPGRVKVVAEVDSATPLSGATLARLGLLGLTGLLYIDLQLDPAGRPGPAAAAGRSSIPVILSRKGDIEAFLERLPDLVGRAGAVMARIEMLLGDENLAAVSESLRNVREASAELPALSRERRRARGRPARHGGGGDGPHAASATRPPAELAGATRATLAEHAVGAEHAGAHRGEPRAHRGRATRRRSSGWPGPGAVELQQLMLDVRDASAEVRALARRLREQPVEPAARVQGARRGDRTMRIQAGLLRSLALALPACTGSLLQSNAEAPEIYRLEGRALRGPRRAPAAALARRARRAPPPHSIPIASRWCSPTAASTISPACAGPSRRRRCCSSCWCGR